MNKEMTKFLLDLKSFVVAEYRANNIEQAFWVLAARVATDSERIDALEVEIKELKERGLRK